MAKMTIERSSEWINKFRDIGIYLDGKKLDVIANGEIKSFDLSPGRHSIYSKIDWITSRELTFDIDEVRGKTFVLKSFANGSFWMTVLASYYLLARKNDFILMEELFI